MTNVMLLPDALPPLDLLILFSLSRVQALGICQVVNGDSQEDIQEDVCVDKVRETTKRGHRSPNHTQSPHRLLHRAHLFSLEHFTYTATKPPETNKWISPPKNTIP